jgi:hypothetical protein
MAHLDDLFRFPNWRDPQAEAQWEEQSCFEEMLPEDWHTAAEAVAPPELDAFQVLADVDDAFESRWGEWMDFTCSTGILLPIEQSCEDGILLPTDQRAIRLASCPEDMLKPLRRFFEGCPRHVKHLLCHYVYWLVRIERARRTGHAHWRPVVRYRSA